MATKTKSRYDDLSVEQLRDLAKERGIEGRSNKSKKELIEALQLSDQGPDSVELIKEQHEGIRELFKELDGMAAGPSKKKDERAQVLVTHLVKHAEVEEIVFYPAARSEVKGLDEDIDEDLEEHHAAELLLREIDRMTSDHERFDAKLKVLEEVTLHHMEEEETTLLPRVKSELDEQRRRELGAAMLRAHKLAPSRPHPRSPDEPPANLVAGLPAAAADAAVGLFRAAKRRIRNR